jgi:hypothetical protein
MGAPRHARRRPEARPTPARGAPARGAPRRPSQGLTYALPGRGPRPRKPVTILGGVTGYFEARTMSALMVRPREGSRDAAGGRAGNARDGRPDAPFIPPPRTPRAPAAAARRRSSTLWPAARPAAAGCRGRCCLQATARRGPSCGATPDTCAPAGGDAGPAGRARSGMGFGALHSVGRGATFGPAAAREQLRIGCSRRSWEPARPDRAGPPPPRPCPRACRWSSLTPCCRG